MKKFCTFLVLIAVTILFTAASGITAQKSVKDESLRMGEKRSTLDANIFSYNARIKEAYQVAKEIPWVLDSIHCFCYCEQAYKHKSLLSCYVDDHAAA